MVRAVIVRTAQEYGRPDGSHIKFDDNAAVLINNQGARAALASSAPSVESCGSASSCGSSHWRQKSFRAGAEKSGSSTDAKDSKRRHGARHLGPK